RDVGTTSKYWGTASVASFKSKGIYSIYRAKTKHDYASTAEVVQWRPTSRIKQSCGDRTISLSYQGVSLSQTSEVCPEWLEADVAGGKKMHGIWGMTWPAAVWRE